jgi:hypothetical protein
VWSKSSLRGARQQIGRRANKNSAQRSPAEAILKAPTRGSNVGDGSGSREKGGQRPYRGGSCRPLFILPPSAFILQEVTNSFVDSRIDQDILTKQFVIQ